MTRLPVEDRRFTPRPDLPAYELADRCASPYQPDGYPLENHHLFRKSADPRLREAYWVELADGKIVPNRVALSRRAHRLVTENKARIILDRDVWYWVDQFETTPLDPQPGPTPYRSTDEELIQASASVDAEGPEPGSECPSCHRRIPHPKKPTSPQTKTFSYRVPMDDVETHTEILEAAAEHIGLAGAPHWKWQLATKGAVLILQTDAKEFV